MKSTLTLKQRRFITNIISGQNGTQAAMDAYDTTITNVAAVISSQNLRKHKIMTAINANLEENNLTDQALQALSYALEATKLTSDQMEVPDHDIRLKASDRALNLLLIANGHKPIF